MAQKKGPLTSPGVPAGARDLPGARARAGHRRRHDAAHASTRSSRRPAARRGRPISSTAITSSAPARRPAAVAGYPSITVPAGFAHGLPVGHVLHRPRVERSAADRAWPTPSSRRRTIGRPPQFLPTITLEGGAEMKSMRLQRPFLALILWPFPGTVAAQGLSYGAKGGVNFATLNLDPDDDRLRLSHRHRGRWIRRTLPLGSRLTIQPEGFFSQKGAKGDLGRRQSDDAARLPRGAGAGEVRALPWGQWIVPRLRRAVACVQAAQQGDGGLWRRELDTGEDERIKDSDFGVVFGAGMNFGRLSIDGRYTFGLDQREWRRSRRARRYARVTITCSPASLLSEATRRAARASGRPSSPGGPATGRRRAPAVACNNALAA